MAATNAPPIAHRLIDDDGNDDDVGGVGVVAI
jgi:hypothetical protein